MRRTHPKVAARADLRYKKEEMLSDPNPLSIDNKNYTGVDSANPTVVPVQSPQEKLLTVNQIPFLWNKPCTKHVSETGVPLDMQ